MALRHEAPAWRSWEAEAGAEEPEEQEAPEECPDPVQMQRLDRETGEIEPIELDCQRKGCPHCGPRLRRRYTAHFTEIFRDLPALFFVTLTIDPKPGITAEDSGAYLRDRWERRFIKRLKRRCEKGGKTLRYVASTEPHADGKVHLHAIMSCPLEPSEIRSQWYRSGGGIVADVQALGGGRERGGEAVARAVGYALKYAFKRQKGGSAGALMNTKAIGYHAAEHKAKRRERAKRDPERYERAGAGEEAAEGRYEWTAPDGAGGRLSPFLKERRRRQRERQRERWDRLQMQYRTVTYVDDRGDGTGTRYTFDRSRGEVIETPVKAVWHRGKKRWREG